LNKVRKIRKRLPATLECVTQTERLYSSSDPKEAKEYSTRAQALKKMIDKGGPLEKKLLEKLEELQKLEKIEKLQKNESVNKQVTKNIFPTKKQTIRQQIPFIRAWSNKILNTRNAMLYFTPNQKKLINKIAAKKMITRSEVETALNFIENYILEIHGKNYLNQLKSNKL
jgi:hypothetical protein